MKIITEILKHYEEYKDACIKAGEEFVSFADYYVSRIEPVH